MTMHTDDHGWKFRAGGAFVERECLLLEAGDYPDRGVKITPDDLRAIAINTPRQVPVKVEHLRESPFDRALGVVTRLRAVENRLWGTLRQPAEAWRFVQRAGARALSVALDLVERKLAEVSFVCRPRVPSAQVFGDGVVGSLGDWVIGNVMLEFPNDLTTQRPDGPITYKEETMTSVRQFAEGLMQYIRGALGGGEETPETERLAAERAQLAAEREAVRARKVEQQIAEFKRQGRLRATDRAEGLARAILLFEETNVVPFGGEEMPLAALFAQFLEENGAVVPMGEIAPAEPGIGAGASDRLLALAREAARRDGLPYLTAFRQVSAAHPDLARAAREEGING
jgi:hypothetical protein